MKNVDREKPVEGLDVVSYSADNYIRGIEFGGWCVAFLNHGERFTAPTYIERHNETDEVFVLIKGKGVIYTIDDGKITRTAMEKGKAYDIKKGTYHHVRVSKRGVLFVVENSNTSRDNTDERTLTQSEIKEMDK
jgi:mannose-6-phosphate isomerase-like protein (cupin superfamily)